MNCFECKISGCEYDNPFGACVKEKEFNLQAPDDLTNSSSTTSSSTHDSYGNGYKPIDEIQEQREALLDNIQEIMESAQALVEAVEGYIAPNKGDKYVFRGEVLEKCNKVKKLLGE